MRFKRDAAPREPARAASAMRSGKLGREKRTAIKSYQSVREDDMDLR